MKHADVILENAVAAAMRVNQKQFGTSAFSLLALKTTHRNHSMSS